MIRRAPVALILAFVLFACGASARETTLRTTYAATNAAARAFEAWDREHQTAIATDATKPQPIRIIELAEYRSRRAPVLTAFDAVYRLIAAAALVEDDPRSMANLLDAANLLRQTLHDFTGGKIP